jgi:16S rRNA (guanine(966)-N(2))-methyltransferase RsmD
MRRTKKPRKKLPNRRMSRPRGESASLRIVGGAFRGRKLNYSGDPRVRPMKDRVREAVFNLVGPAVRGKNVIDLFAGTGALALEALSRGAAQAILIEQHLPTAATISSNIDLLGVESRCRLVKSDVFVWHKRGPDLGTAPWLVFCSPPYDFYVQQRDKMLSLLGGLIDLAPADSMFVVEADDRFDFGQLPQPQSWDIRAYLPALIGIYRQAANS